MRVEDGNTRVIYLTPLIFTVAIIPLIVYGKEISVTGILVDYWSKSFDFFSYYKMIFLLLATVVAIILFIIYYLRNKELKSTYYYLLIEIYAILIIMSTYHSAYRRVALWGFPDRYEGALVLLSYLIILVITINLTRFKQDFKLLLIPLFISAVVISIIGLFQYCGVDLLTTLIGKRLILPAQMNNLIDKLEPKFDYIFATLYNPNYVGSYMGMLLALSFSCYTLFNKSKNRIFLGIVTLFIFSNWLGSLSRAGMVGGLIAIVLAIIILRKELIKQRQAILILVVGLAIVFTTMNYIGEGRLVKEFFSFGNEAKIAIKGQQNSLQDIKINKNKLRIITVKDELKVYFTQNNQLLFKDKQGNKINYQLQKDGKIELLDKDYQNYKFRLLADARVLYFKYREKNVKFEITTSPERGFWIIGFADKSYKTGKVSAWGFEGRERLGSGRGYIWSRSLPMLKNTIFTGYGPDTYVLYFPQYDNVGKLITFNSTQIVVDKPHNMYLQVAINTGVVSLLSLLLFFIFYLVSSWQIYWNVGFNSFYHKLGVSIFFAVIAYLIAGLFNDSVISVAPVFWILFGMGISINLKLKNGYNQKGGGYVN